MRGRPRAFDRDAALYAAVRVFWEHGYDGASMSDLIAAMGITSSSLYAAFGSKQELFFEAARAYGEREGAAGRKALENGPTARESVRAFLRRYAREYTDPANPRGCMIVLAAHTYTAESAPARDQLRGMRHDTERALRARVERGIAAGDVPAGARPADVAAYYNAVLEGMSVQARDGASRAALTRLADAAVASWDAVVRG